MKEEYTCLLNVHNIYFSGFPGFRFKPLGVCASWPFRGFRMPVGRGVVYYHVPVTVSGARRVHALAIAVFAPG